MLACFMPSSPHPLPYKSGFSSHPSWPHSFALFPENAFSQVLSFQAFPHSSKMWISRNSFLPNNFHTLCQKHRGCTPPCLPISPGGSIVRASMGVPTPPLFHKNINLQHLRSGSPKNFIPKELFGLVPGLADHDGAVSYPVRPLRRRCSPGVHLPSAPQRRKPDSCPTR